MTDKATKGILLFVISKASQEVPIGKIAARVGLRTDRGVITRLTPKGFEVERPDGTRWVFHTNIHRPSVWKSHAPKGEIIPLKEIA